MGVVLGKLYPALEPTQEMLARTQPQLLDLLVAIFSGFAGAYALVDEKISPALPGVAIATAIVPPLANTGLCFAVGAYAGGVGSFLLFFSNFLSILLVASVVFWFFGMAGRYRELDRRVIAKRFGLPIVGFILIALVLTHTLYKISKDRGINNTIENVLIEELANLPSASFDKMIYEVVNLERLISEKTGQPFQLDVFSNIATVATSRGYESYKKYTDRVFEKLQPKLMTDLKDIIENSKM